MGEGRGPRVALCDGGGRGAAGGWWRRGAGQRACAAQRGVASLRRAPPPRAVGGVTRRGHMTVARCSGSQYGSGGGRGGCRGWERSPLRPPPLIAGRVEGKKKRKSRGFPPPNANDMREKGRRKKGRTWAEAARTVRGAWRREGGGPALRGGAEAGGGPDRPALRPRVRLGGGAAAGGRWVVWKRERRGGVDRRCG